MSTSGKDQMNCIMGRRGSSVLGASPELRAKSQDVPSCFSVAQMYFPRMVKASLTLLSL